jgi:hypothetical protein
VFFKTPTGFPIVCGCLEKHPQVFQLSVGV